MQVFKTQNKKLVTLSGDLHNGWFTHLAMLAGDKVGVEFAGTFVTSGGFDSAGLGMLASAIDGSALVPQLANGAVGAGLGPIDDVNYCDTNQRGYLLMTITPAVVKGDYVFVSSVKQPAYTSGGAVGSWLTKAHGPQRLFPVCAGLTVLWLVIASVMKTPPHRLN